MQMDTWLVPCVSLREETLFFTLGCPLLQIKAGAKSSVTRTGENTDPDLRIASYLFTDVNNFPSHLMIDRVHNLRTIQCDVTDVVLYIVDDGLMVHDDFSFFSWDFFKNFTCRLYLASSAYIGGWIETSGDESKIEVKSCL